MKDRPAPAERYAFGDFVLERAQQRVLHRDGTALNLSPRLFSALLLFVERAGELVDKDTLILFLWPGLVVEDNNLSQVVSALRRELGDGAHESRYIQTVPRRGFRFVAAVTPLSAERAVNADASTSPTPRHVAFGLAATSAPDVPSAPAVAGTWPRRRWLQVAGVAGAGAAATAWWFIARPGSDGASPPAPTLAVLPFKPLVAEGRDELLEVGMADSLIARLSTVPGMVVRSVGSVRRYAGPDQDPLRAARELDVTWIVDGSLQRRGDLLRVTARLLRVADGSAAWSGSFDERFTNVFDVQDAISAKVAGVLALALDPRAGAGTPAAMTASGGTRDADAYQLYLAARQQAQGIRAAGLRKSAALYNQAIEVDPRYALAYAGLVETYRRMLFGADVAPADAFEPAKVAAARALEIAPQLAEAHAGLGWIRSWYDFDWDGAEKVFRRALALNANVVEAQFGLGLLLLSLDRPDEGLARLRTARELDPMSLILNALESAYLFARGRRTEAAARLDRAFQIEPEFWVAHLVLGVRQTVDGKPEDALSSFRHADALAEGSSQATVALGRQLAAMGRVDEARRVLERLLAAQKVRYLPPTSVAALHAALGESAPALDALERAFAVRDTRLVYLKDDVRWTGLRQEPRFIALLARMRLDRYGPGAPAP